MNNSISATLLVGFLLGLKHATDTDHIVAVSTLVSDTIGARRAARVGAYWGLGHRHEHGRVAQRTYTSTRKVSLATNMIPKATSTLPAALAMARRR